MNPQSGVRQPGQRRRGSGMRGQKVPQHMQQQPNPSLFDDTSTQAPPVDYSELAEQPEIQVDASSAPINHQGMSPMNYNQPVGGQYDNQMGGYSFAGQQYLSDPMANVAVQYGQTLAGQSKEYVNKNLEKYVSASKIKYYFAVDTTYVGKKIGLLIFPFAHTDWSIQYNQAEPVAPRYEINAPDLYIPVMAFVTYILLAGVMLGTQDRFTPEQLGITASTALVWIIIEILFLLMSMYIMQVTTDLRYLDLLAYCGYKYVGMILVMLGGMFFESMGYYIVLLWTSLSLAFFLVRALKFAIIPHTDPESYARGNKRRMYTLFLIALSQPVFIWWLTRHLVPS